MNHLKAPNNESIIKTLSSLAKDYDDVTKLRTKVINRAHSLNPGSVKSNKTVKELKITKDRLSRELLAQLEFWPVWTEWMKQVPGIGPFIAANLIMLYYYKFTAICKECGADLDTETKETREDGSKVKSFNCSACGKKASGQGLLHHRITRKTFPNVSKWWAYMGRACDPETGMVQKRQSGKQSNFSSKGKLIGYHIWQGVNKNQPAHHYKDYMLKQKETQLKKNEDREEPWTDGHIHNAAGHETAKLVLSHFWHVARFLEEESTDGLYMEIIKGHLPDNRIPPFYWTLEDELDKVA